MGVSGWMKWANENFTCCVMATSVPWPPMLVLTICVKKGLLGADIDCKYNGWEQDRGDAPRGSLPTGP